MQSGRDDTLRGVSPGAAALRLLLFDHLAAESILRRSEVESVGFAAPPRRFTSPGHVGASLLLDA
jgi:hypothetical protein